MHQSRRARHSYSYTAISHRPYPIDPAATNAEPSTLCSWLSIAAVTIPSSLRTRAKQLFAIGHRSLAGLEAGLAVGRKPELWLEARDTTIHGTATCQQMVKHHCGVIYLTRGDLSTSNKTAADEDTCTAEAAGQRAANGVHTLYMRCKLV